MDKTKQVDEPVNPFQGQGGSFYINPKGSNTFKRDRNSVVPFGALTDAEKAARILSVPEDQMDAKSRADHLARLKYTEAELAAAMNSTLQSASSSADPAAASVAAGESAAKASASAKKVSK